MIGAEPPSRRVLIDEIMREPVVRRAIETATREQRLPVARTNRLARHHAREIAADFSYPFALLMRPLLRRLWRHLYDDVTLHHGDAHGEIIAGHTPVYLPCHRSHIDYLLLPYLLDARDLPVPHAAAGDNLNLPILGRILRWGGAFFVRRSFRDDRLYGAVFQSYITTLLRYGVTLEYFIEGGRSRTGRLREPRFGLLDMTVRAGLAYPERPLVLIPVHIAYESVAEGEHYLDELAGRPKQRESLRSLWHGLLALRQRRGEVHVNLGEPLYLQSLLDRQYPDWRESAHSALLERPDWLPPIVTRIAKRIACCINDAVVVTPIGLLACVVLDAYPQPLADGDLIQRYAALQRLLRQWRYSERCIVTERNGADAIARACRLALLQRPEAGMVAASPEQAGLLAYHRNGLHHVLALPIEIARGFEDAETHSTDALLTRLTARYPLLRDTLFLHWNSDRLAPPVIALLDTLTALGWLDGSTEGWRRPAIGTPGASMLQLLASIGRDSEKP